MADSHTVHCRNGGKVVIVGDRVEVHLNGPLVYERKHWTKYLLPRDEVERTLRYTAGTGTEVVTVMLEEAFSAAKQVVHRDTEDE